MTMDWNLSCLLNDLGLDYKMNHLAQVEDLASGIAQIDKTLNFPPPPFQNKSPVKVV